MTANTYINVHCTNILQQDRISFNESPLICVTYQPMYVQYVCNVYTQLQICLIPLRTQFWIGTSVPNLVSFFDSFFDSRVSTPFPAARPVFLWSLHLPHSLQAPGDAETVKGVPQIQKSDKAPSPFEGENNAEQEANDVVIQSNGIIQNGLEEDRYIRWESGEIICTHASQNPVLWPCVGVPLAGRTGVQCTFHCLKSLFIQ